MRAHDGRRQPMLDVVGQYSGSQPRLRPLVGDAVLVTAVAAGLYVVSRSVSASGLLTSVDLPILFSAAAAAAAVSAAVLWGILYRFTADARTGAVATAMLIYGFVTVPVTLIGVALGRGETMVLSVRLASNIPVALLLILAGGGQPGRATPSVRWMLVSSLAALGLVALAVHADPDQAHVLASRRPLRYMLVGLYAIAGARICVRAARHRVSPSVRAGLGALLLAVALAYKIHRELGAAEVRPDLTFATLRLFGLLLLLTSAMQLTRRALEGVSRQQRALHSHLQGISDRLNTLGENDHELRNGLAGVVGATQLIDGPADGHDAEALSAAVATELSRLVGLLTSGARPYGEAADVRAVLDQVIVVHGPALPPIEVAVAHGLVAHIDPEALSQLLINLLTNCARHASQSGVQVRAELTAQRPRSIAIEVIDQGPGVPAGTEELVFERGVRAMTSPGDGLGLHICRTLAIHHGGDIRIVPGGPGCTVRMTLPAHATDAPAPAAVTAPI